MALQSLARPVFWPNISGYGSAARTIGSSVTLDAAGEYTGMVFRATEAMTVSHVMFRTATVAGSPTIDVRIETVDATTGLPTGTLWATNTNVISGTLVSNTVTTVALTASASIASGDVVCVKFLYNSGTSVILSTLSGAQPTATLGFPYVVNNTGTPAKAALSLGRIMALGSSATQFYRIRGMVPVSNAVAQSFSTTNGDAFANRFQVPFKCRCAGIALVTSAATGEFTYGIYSDAGSELSSSSTAFDIDQVVIGVGNTILLYFDNFVTLSPATWYRAAIWPVNTTAVGGYRWTTATDASEAMPYENFHYATKATGGAWTDTATDDAIVMDLIIDQLDDGVGGGGATIQSYPIIG